MATITQFMTAEQVASAASQVEQAVSGLSAREAAAALGAQNIGTNGFTKITTFPFLGGNNFKPVTVEAQYAAQTWNYYKTAAQAAGITSFGAAAGAAATWANGVLFGGETLAAGGLLTLSVPTAIAMAAPLMGVAIGESLYNANPQLFDKIAEKISPYVYEGTQAVAAVFDKLGQVFLPKGLVDGVKEVFDEEGIGGETGRISDLDTNLAQPIKIQSSGIDGTGHPFSASCPFILSWSGGATRLEFVSPVMLDSVELNFWNNYESKYETWQSRVTSSFTHDGKTVYYKDFISGALYKPESMDYYDTTPDNNSRWTAVYGEEVGSYPEGTSEWTGTKPATLPIVPIIIEIPADPGESIVTAPYTPIQLPAPEPGPAPVPVPPNYPTPYISPDPEKQPDPQAPTPLPYIDPFIDPYIPWQWPKELPRPEKDEESEKDPYKAPIPDPVSRPEPYPDPRLDPTRDPYPIPKPDPAPVPDPRIWPDSPVTPNPPPSEGESPTPLPDFIDWPSEMPTSDASGLIHIYNPTPSEVQAFGRWLWVTWQDATIEKMWNNPFDGVIGLMELFVTPSTGGSEYIRSGFLTSNVSSATVPTRYVTINCGSIVIPEYWKNYLDYAPYTRAHVYLPFIGIVEVEADDIVGHAVNIVYHVDTYNGSCIAQITVARDNYCNTLYQYSGNCAVDVPISGGTQASIRAGMIQAAAWGISSVIGGLAGAAGTMGSGSPNVASAIGQAVSGAAYGVAHALNSVVSAKSSVQHSGSFGASYGAMGIKTPYIIIHRPIQKVVDNYNKDYGFPAHKMVQIGSCTGFLRVREVNVISPTASNDEKSLIEQLLKSGVYVT